ncbi:DUF5131 family protein [Oscillibacter sp.]|uniref:DUF5131 family protein n=1 Tax=Oscillibacter sp. TaxID=1945593 RepID=UPI0028AFD3B0|nr:DUF5131 family protein [Oscillibacter sp.]
MAMWNPWRGCHKYSEGCRFCYIHKGDARRGVDTNVVTKVDNFFAPIERYKRGEKKGEYKMKSGETVYLCFSSDFLLPDTDQWRSDCWRIMRERHDLNFLFLTKRIERFVDCVPPDWGDGYENVTVGCTVENQAEAYRRLPLFDTLPIVHKNIILQPMLGKMNIERHLDGVELVVVGGESDRNARPLDYAWVLDVREQCLRQGVKFEFRQCGSNFVKDGKLYQLPVRQLMSQARKANINT